MVNLCTDEPLNSNHTQMLPTTDRCRRALTDTCTLGILGPTTTFDAGNHYIYTKTISSHYLFDPAIWLNDEILYWIYELPYGRFCKIIHFEIQYAVFKDQIKKWECFWERQDFNSHQKKTMLQIHTSWGASAAAIHTMPLGPWKRFTPNVLHRRQRRDRCGFGRRWVGGRWRHPTGLSSERDRKSVV